MFVYKTHGTCAAAIELEIQDGIITHCAFIHGCPGNTAGICRLVMGMKAEDVAARLEGTQCANKGTSCPDQLSKAIRAYPAE